MRVCQVTARLRLTFTAEGEQDGPLARKHIEDGRTPDQLAHYFATELKRLLVREMGDDPNITSRVNVRASADIYESSERTGHAEATTDES